MLPNLPDKSGTKNYFSFFHFTTVRQLTTKENRIIKRSTTDAMKISFLIYRKRPNVWTFSKLIVPHTSAPRGISATHVLGTMGNQGGEGLFLMVSKSHRIGNHQTPEKPK